MIGSWLGEAMIASHGASWVWLEGDMAVSFPDVNFQAFPLNKVAKQFQHGAKEGEGILGYFQAIGPIIEQLSREQEA